jgi:phosphopantothenoylcysteine decarboxylase/phosphopantothenate--cysteine ligase
LGAEVTLISGPVSISSQSPDVKIVLVKTANEMCEKCKEHFDSVDIAVFAAAVADYRPLLQSDCIFWSC